MMCLINMIYLFDMIYLKIYIYILYLFKYMIYMIFDIYIYVLYVCIFVYVRGAMQRAAIQDTAVAPNSLQHECTPTCAPIFSLSVRSPFIQLSVHMCCHGRALVQDAICE